MDFLHVQSTLIQIIKRYSDNHLPVTDADVISDQLDAPYIAVNQYGPVDSVNSNAHFPVVVVHYQVKIVTEGGASDFNPQAKAQCANIADWLRRIWFYNQPKYDLWKQGIEPLQPCPTLGLNTIYLTNFNQYQDGASLTLYVNDPDDDNTQPGEIHSVKFGKHTIRKD